MKPILLIFENNAIAITGAETPALLLRCRLRDLPNQLSLAIS